MSNQIVCISLEVRSKFTDVFCLKTFIQRKAAFLIIPSVVCGEKNIKSKDLVPFLKNKFFGKNMSKKQKKHLKKRLTQKDLYFKKNQASKIYKFSKILNKIIIKKFKRYYLKFKSNLMIFFKEKLSADKIKMKKGKIFLKLIISIILLNKTEKNIDNYLIKKKKDMLFLKNYLLLWKNSKQTEKIISNYKIKKNLFLTYKISKIKHTQFIVIIRKNSKNILSLFLNSYFLRCLYNKKIKIFRKSCFLKREFHKYIFSFL